MTPGVVIDGKYRVLRKIGEGGMASVYEAENMRLGNRVALKKMHGSLKSHEANVERFRKEAAALSAVSHPNIVRILDVVEVDGVPILVMELLEGRTLGELLKVNGRPPSNELDRLARQMLSALAHLHQRGYTHRDIKPENIFFHRLSSHEAVYRLMDFGVAQEGVDHSMTSTGLFVGTRRYASPEQIRNPKGVDHRSDLYSLGVTLWQCATGRTPHEGVETEFEMMRAITEQPKL